MLELWSVYVFHAPGATWVGSIRRRISDPEGRGEFDGETAAFDALPGWMRPLLPRDRFAQGIDSREMRLILGTGWPVESLWCEADIDSQHNTATFRGGFKISEQRTSWDMIPVTPLWPGFAINSVFYALVLWPLLAAPYALRRWLRVKRGLCPKCAYPVGASDVCTECGTTLSRKVETSTRPNVQIMND